jgi:hypothetical protein
MKTPTQPPAAGEAAHTPTATPYRVEELTGNQVAIMADCRVLALMQVVTTATHRNENRLTNAAFIVRACNSHAANLALIASYDAREARNLAALAKADEENERLRASHAALVEALEESQAAITRLLNTGRFDSKASLGAIARAQYVRDTIARAALEQARTP